MYPVYHVLDTIVQYTGHISGMLELLRQGKARQGKAGKARGGIYGAQPAHHLTLEWEPSCIMSSLLRRCSRPCLRLLVLMVLPFRKVPFRLPVSVTCQQRWLGSHLMITWWPDTSVSGTGRVLSSSRPTVTCYPRSTMSVVQRNAAEQCS